MVEVRTNGLFGGVPLEEGIDVWIDVAVWNVVWDVALGLELLVVENDVAEGADDFSVEMLEVEL